MDNFTDPASDALRELAVMPPVEAVVVPSPQIDKWGLDMYSWIQTLAEDAARSESPMDRIIAAGVVKRLYLPKSSTEKKRLMEEMLSHGISGKEIPGFVEWVESMNIAVFMTAEYIAIADADQLHSALVLFEENKPAEETEWSKYADMLRTSRDELESILEVLKSKGMGMGDDLASTLNSLDETANDRLMLIDECGSNMPRLLATVGWSNPHAWWGVTYG
jgi:hypothetical protein